MKLFLSLLFYCSMPKSYGQNTFPAQFQLLITNVEKGLIKYRGDFKEIIDGDSIFYSTTNLKGTNRNEITFSNKKFHYMANLEGLSNKKKGKKTVDRLKSEIESVLNASYSVSQLEKQNWNPGIYGWRFKRNGITVSITLYSKKITADYFITIGIDNFDSENPI